MLSGGFDGRRHEGRRRRRHHHGVGLRRRRRKEITIRRQRAGTRTIEIGLLQSRRQRGALQVEAVLTDRSQHRSGLCWLRQVVPVSLAILTTQLVALITDSKRSM